MHFLPAALLIVGAAAFQPSARLLRPPGSAPPAITCLAGKGFGSGAPPPPAPKKKRKASSSSAAAAAATSSAGAAPTTNGMAGDDPTLLTAEERGRRALEEMRKSSGTGDVQLKKRTSLVLTPEEMEPEADSVMPEAVANRMLSRILPFAALPVVGGVLIFIAFYIANTQLELDVPPTIVAYATQAMLLLSFGGITYGVMSTNLEEDADQTLLGADNVKKNLNIMRGVEDERIAETKEFEEMLDAKDRGIVTSVAEAKKRGEQL